MTTPIWPPDWSSLLTWLNPCLPLAKTLPSREQLKAEDIIVKYWHHLPCEAEYATLPALSLSCLRIRGGMERRRLEHRSLTATPLLLVLVNLNKNTMQILLEYHRRVAPVSISSNKTEKYLNETLFRSDQTDLAKFSKWWSLILMRSTCLVSLLKSCLVREYLNLRQNSGSDFPNQEVGNNGISC